ncbi:MAG: hypothetical protein SH818_01990, partial [Saprospiraceae bacterium]|nr:hypothetical protein [Saprospiraceae bacterium]
MKKTNILFAFLLCFISIHVVSAQVTQPVNANVSIIQVTNGQTYYDSGGPNGNYAICGDNADTEENCTSTVTMCGTGVVYVSFVTFSLFTGADKLSVYNGGADGTLIKEGTALNPLSGTYTSTDPSGCLTFKFFSTSINASVGWEANIILKTTTIEREPGPDCNLICNNHVNASMPFDTCYRTFDVDDFLENYGVCNYDIRISYPFGTNRLNGYDVNRSHIGYTMVYSVFDLSTG